MIQGDRLRCLREQAGMTQTRLGLLIGQDQQYVSKLERGVLRGMTVETLERLCRALQVSTDYLLDFSCSATVPSPDIGTIATRKKLRRTPDPQGRTDARAPEQSEPPPVAVAPPPAPQPTPNGQPVLCPHCAVPMQPLGDRLGLVCHACRYAREDA